MSTITNESPYTWLNEAYIKKILSKYEDQAAELVEYKLSSGSSQGENFAGVILRVKINYTLSGNKKDVNFILKTSPVAGAISELLETLNVFAGESFIYQKILKDCDELLPSLKMAPRLIYVDDNAMVLEDLTELDFELANRKNKFDLVRSKLALSKIAQFHAVTAKLYQNDPASMEHHKASAHDIEEMTPLSFFFSVSLQESLETIRNCNDLKAFVDFLESYDILKEEKTIYSRNDSDRFHVLNHGDLWINNIFFKYNENKEPIDVLFVDYQESYWGSPGIDFNHFLYTSCNDDVHNNHIDELIEFYYDNLIDALKKLKFDKLPSLDDIRYEIQNKLQQGLIALLSVVPVQMIENTEHANPEYFLADTDEAQVIRREVYGNQKYVELLKFHLPKLAARGVFGQIKNH